MPSSGDDITRDSDIIRRSHGIKTDSSEMCWLGRGRLNVTQERKRSMRVNLWLWQLPPADASPPPPLHPLLPPALPTPGKSPARWKQSLSLSIREENVASSHIRWQRYVSSSGGWCIYHEITKRTGLGETMRLYLPPAPPHKLNPFILSWINPSCYLALRHGIICHKVYFCVNFCTCAKTFFFGKIEVLTVNNFDVISGLNSWQMIFFPWIICSVRKLALSLLLIMQEINNTLYWSNNF